MKFQYIVAQNILILSLVLVGCSPSQPPASPSPTAGSSGESSPTSIAPSAPTTDNQGQAILYRIVPEQSEVRYRVREQLARLNFPTDAVGSTRAISGTLALDPQGKLLPEHSSFEVDLSTLKSDEGRRDNFLRQNTLETARYPHARFVPKAVDGLPVPLPDAGAVTFKLTGDLTIKDVTKPVTWDVTATVQGDQVTGHATTKFTFADFRLEKPTVMVVLTVDDTINLEVDFTLQKGSAP